MPKNIPLPESGIPIGLVVAALLLEQTKESPEDGPKDKNSSKDGPRCQLCGSTRPNENCICCNPLHTI